MRRDDPRNVFGGATRPTLAGSVPVSDIGNETDLDLGRRYASLVDFQKFVKLTCMSLWLHHFGGTVREPVDIPVNNCHLDMVYAYLRDVDFNVIGQPVRA